MPSTIRKYTNQRIKCVLCKYTLFDKFIYILESFAAVSTGAGDTKINSSIGLLL